MQFSENQTLTLLLEEWRLCEGAIRGYDELGMKIKTWAITLFSGSIYLAINTSSSEIALAFLPAAIAFWFFDALYKGYQQKFIERGREITNFLRKAMNSATSKDENQQPHAEFVFPGYDQKFTDRGDFSAAISCIFHSNIAALYFPLIVLSFVIAFGNYVR